MGVGVTGVSFRSTVGSVAVCRQLRLEARNRIAIVVRVRMTSPPAFESVRPRLPTASLAFRYDRETEETKSSGTETRFPGFLQTCV